MKILMRLIGPLILSIVAAATSCAQQVQTMGSPTTVIESKGTFKADSGFIVVPRDTTYNSIFKQTGLMWFQPSDTTPYIYFGNHFVGLATQSWAMQHGGGGGGGQTYYAGNGITDSANHFGLGGLLYKTTYLYGDSDLSFNYNPYTGQFAPGLPWLMLINDQTLGYYAGIGTSNSTGQSSGYFMSGVQYGKNNSHNWLSGNVAVLSYVNNTLTVTDTTNTHLLSLTDGLSFQLPAYSNTDTTKFVYFTSNGTQGQRRLYPSTIGAIGRADNGIVDSNGTAQFGGYINQTTSIGLGSSSLLIGADANLTGPVSWLYVGNSNTDAQLAVQLNNDLGTGQAIFEAQEIQDSAIASISTDSSDLNISQHRLELHYQGSGGNFGDVLNINFWGLHNGNFTFDPWSISDTSAFLQSNSTGLTSPRHIYAHTIGAYGPQDTGRAASNIATGGSLNKAIDSLASVDVATIYTTPTISGMQSYTGTLSTVIVTDSIRGGVFQYDATATQFDNGTVLQSTGKAGGYRRIYAHGRVALAWYPLFYDQTTDNASVINAAINYWTNGSVNEGVTLVMPRGTFRVSKVHLKKSTVIEAEQHAVSNWVDSIPTTFKPMPGQTGPMFYFDSTQRNAGMKGINIDGDFTNSPTLDSVIYFRGTFCSLEDVNIANVAYRCVVSDAGAFTATHCNFQGWEGNVGSISFADTADYRGVVQINSFGDAEIIHCEIGGGATDSSQHDIHGRCDALVMNNSFNSNGSIRDNIFELSDIGLVDLGGYWMNFDNNRYEFNRRQGAYLKNVGFSSFTNERFLSNSRTTNNAYPDVYIGTGTQSLVFSTPRFFQEYSSTIPGSENSTSFNIYNGGAYNNTLISPQFFPTYGQDTLGGNAIDFVRGVETPYLDNRTFTTVAAGDITHSNSVGGIEMIKAPANGIGSLNFFRANGADTWNLGGDVNAASLTLEADSVGAPFNIFNAHIVNATAGLNLALFESSNSGNAGVEFVTGSSFSEIQQASGGNLSLFTTGNVESLNNFQADGYLLLSSLRSARSTDNVLVWNAGDTVGERAIYGSGGLGIVDTTILGTKAWVYKVVDSAAFSGGGGSSFYQTMQNASSSVTQRPRLNFGSQFLLTDDAGNTSTDVTLQLGSLAGNGLVYNSGTIRLDVDSTKFATLVALKDSIQQIDTTYYIAQGTNSSAFATIRAHGDTVYHNPIAAGTGISIARGSGADSTLYISATGGGGGNTNSNIGSGYRLAQVFTNNIKTIGLGYAQLGDSTSNTNEITLGVDTTKVIPYTDTTKNTGILTKTQFNSAYFDTSFLLGATGMPTKGADSLYISPSLVGKHVMVYCNTIASSLPVYDSATWAQLGSSYTTLYFKINQTTGTLALCNMTNISSIANGTVVFAITAGPLGYPMVTSSVTPGFDSIRVQFADSTGDITQTGFKKLQGDIATAGGNISVTGGNSNTITVTAIKSAWVPLNPTNLTGSTTGMNSCSYSGYSINTTNTAFPYATNAVSGLWYNSAEGGSAGSGSGGTIAPCIQISGLVAGHNYSLTISGACSTNLFNDIDKAQQTQYYAGSTLTSIQTGTNNPVPLCNQSSGAILNPATTSVFSSATSNQLTADSGGNLYIWLITTEDQSVGGISAFVLTQLN